MNQSTFKNIEKVHEDILKAVIAEWEYLGKECLVEVVMDLAKKVKHNNQRANLEDVFGGDFVNLCELYFDTYNVLSKIDETVNKKDANI